MKYLLITWFIILCTICAGEIVNRICKCFEKCASCKYGVMEFAEGDNDENE